MKKSKYIILNNKFFILDMNQIFPQNNCLPKETNKETKDAPIKEKKEENQLSLKEGKNISRLGTLISPPIFPPKTSIPDKPIFDALISTSIFKESENLKLRNSI